MVHTSKCIWQWLYLKTMTIGPRMWLRFQIHVTFCCLCLNLDKHLMTHCFFFYEFARLEKPLLVMWRLLVGMLLKVVPSQCFAIWDVIKCVKHGVPKENTCYFILRRNKRTQDDLFHLTQSSNVVLRTMVVRKWHGQWQTLDPKHMCFMLLWLQEKKFQGISIITKQFQIPFFLMSVSSISLWVTRAFHTGSIKNEL